MGLSMIGISYFYSPVGWLRLEANNEGLESLTLNALPSMDEQVAAKSIPVHPILKLAHTQLSEYFSGDRFLFDLPLSITGTDFQQKCWSALCQIPYAKTCCYQDVAIAVNSPKAVRAVGMANNRNPIAIIIPCHRVIGKNGSLVGYGGGLSIKQWLLDFETQNSKN